MNTVNTIVPGKHDGLSATLAESMCVREAGIRGAFAPFCGGHSRSFVVIRGHSRSFLSEAAARRSRFALEILRITVIGRVGGCQEMSSELTPIIILKEKEDTHPDPQNAQTERLETAF